jgi:hypothetical protein
MSASTAAQEPRRHRRISTVALVASALLLAAFGAGAVIQGSQTKTPHAQPLPESPFALDPSAAATLAAPQALQSPQPGSSAVSCDASTQSSMVSIPSLCINAPLVDTDESGGAVRIPSDVKHVGIDTDSAPLAATAGTTLIVGHVDDVNQGDGAFYFIHSAAAGAEITVTDSSGVSTLWKVFKVSSVSKSALPSDIFNASTGPRQLVLVTCGGALLHINGAGTYADNVLVYATPAAADPAAPNSP